MLAGHMLSVCKKTKYLGVFIRDKKACTHSIRLPKMTSKGSSIKNRDGVMQVTCSIMQGSFENSDLHFYLLTI